MKRWLLLSLLPIALLLLAAGALTLQSSDEAQAGAISSDSAACAAVHTDVDSGALVSSVDGSSLTSSDEALMAAKCYLVGIDVLRGGCGSDDLWILRYLCYDPGKGWYYVNYWYCQ
jgi:hypothetical protein